MKWFVVFVEAGKEENVQKWFEFFFNKDALQCLIPKRKITEKKQGETNLVTKKLFSGYIFIKTEMDISKYKLIKSIPSVIRILNKGNYYSEVDENEMKIILKLINNDGFIELSQAFVENSRVFIKAGPLLGLEGIIKKIDKRKNRAKVQLNLMGEPRLIDVGLEIVYNS